MTEHYHGTPLTPRAELMKLVGYRFCVSHAQQQDIRVCHEIGAGVMLDNGAFTAWTQKREPDWADFYRFAEIWLRYVTTWAVIPDVIDGDEAANDALIEQWPHGDRGAPVWHMHESIDRLLRLAREWNLVCIGSSRQYRIVGSARWHGRMVEAMNVLYAAGPPRAKLHMLRGMQFAGSHYPFARVDSTDIARNHNRKQNSVVKMAARWATQHCPTTWSPRPVQQEFAA